MFQIICIQSRPLQELYNDSLFELLRDCTCGKRDFDNSCYQRYQISRHCFMREFRIRSKMQLLVGYRTISLLIGVECQLPMLTVYADVEPSVPEVCGAGLCVIVE